MSKQEMSLDTPPRGNVPEWGRRIRFDKFSVELVPAGERSLNVQLRKPLPPSVLAATKALVRSRATGCGLTSGGPTNTSSCPLTFRCAANPRAAPEVLAFAFHSRRSNPISPRPHRFRRTPGPRVIIGGPKPFTTEIAQRIRRHMQAEVVSRDYLHALGFILIVEMLRLPPRQQATGRGATLNDRVLRSILDYIDANLDANLSLEILAGLAGVLTHRFGRAFKRKVGEPPHQYVLSRRIEAGRVMLRTTDLSIADIAYATGFSSQSHMTTTFRREIGATPAQLRSENED